jgi:hypothetical protein
MSVAVIKSISINSNMAQEKVCECFNADFFQAIRLIRPEKLKSFGMPDFIGFPNFKTFDYVTCGDLEDPEITSFVAQFEF